MGWLLGTLADAGIQLPETFDLKGILSLVMQVLGLTYPNIRKRAVSILGPDIVSKLEQAAEIFKILITQGPSGLWEYIKDKIGDLKATVIDGIKSFVTESVVVAGITWIVSLLNPASAFVKAAKAIYDIVMFFVNNGSKIMSLVNAIIDSVSAIADGNIGVAAAAVENALGKTIAPAISFLASLLGLGGISDKIRSIIEKIQGPVNKAIDWVIQKAVDLVKAAGNLFGIGKKEEKQKDEDPEKALKVEAGLVALDQEGQHFVKDGKIAREDAEKVAAKVKSDHPIFKSLVVVDGGGTWDYDYVASPGKKSKGKPQARSPDHRGSVQIQGKMLKKEQTRGWARPTPMPAADALGYLQECYNALQAREQNIVNPAYIDAQNRIRRFQSNGGHWVPPEKPGNIRPSDTVPGIPGSQLRVDLENHKGGAFV
jgi:hypothetical protein